VLMARSGKPDAATPARVRFRSLPPGRREDKFASLSTLTLDGAGWADCLTDWRAPFLPAASGGWATYPGLADLFVYDGSGVMPGRTWVIAPDKDSLEARWKKLTGEADPERKEVLFHPHLRGGELGDKYSGKLVSEGLHGHEYRPAPVAKDLGRVVAPVRYGFRSFDRQWIIPDSRLLNQPNPTLWEMNSGQQVYLTALMQHTPTNGPAVTFTGLIPDLHHYKGSFGGRAFPLLADAKATQSNFQPGLLAALAATYGAAVAAEDVLAYIAAVAAHPDYIARFATDLVQPGLRIPLTSDAACFADGVKIGREVIWLHTFGERFVDPADGRPAGAPRMPVGERPTIPRDGAIPSSADGMPETITYNPTARRLHIGSGHIDNVPQAVWDYEVSGKQVLTQWFSYRGRDRSRPMIGDRRTPSPLGDIQPDGWLAEYTTELLNVLNILGRLVALEPAQVHLLDRICAGPTIPDAELKAAIAAAPGAAVVRKSARPRTSKQMELLRS
jgi:hypothetical protein